MKRTMKRIVSVMLALAITLAMSLPAFAADVTPSTSTEIEYLDSKSGTSSIYVDLAYGNKSFTIKRSDIKITPGGTGAKLTYFSKYASNSAYASYYSGKWTSGKSNSWSYYADVEVRKAGTAVVAYKIGSKTYKKKIKVYAYKNPAKSIAMSGVNGSKNFASLTNNASYASKNLALKANKSNAKVVVKPISGWKVTEVEVYDDTNNSRVSFNNYKGVASATLNCGNIVANHNYTVSASFKNNSTEGTLRVNYYIKGAKAK